MKHQQQSTKLSIWTAPLKKCVRRHTMFNPIFLTFFFATVICFIRICFVIYVRTWAVLYVNKRKIDLCHIKMPFEANRMQSGYIWVGDVWWAHLFSHSNLGENTLWEESSPASIWIVYTLMMLLMRLWRVVRNSFDTNTRAFATHCEKKCTFI